MSKRKTTEQVVREFKEVWGDRWDYSDTLYVNVSTRLEIRCKEHNETFTQLPQNHLRGQVGCSQCFKRRHTTTDFIKKARSKLGDRYDYSQTSYVTNHQKVIIICRDHGPFEQSPSNHLSKREGCPRCLGFLRTEEDFYRKAQEVWGSRWDYSETVFVSPLDKIYITCKNHGPFLQSPKSHCAGYVGCSECNGRVGGLDREEFIRRSTMLNGGRWDYSHTEYTNIKDRVTIRCPDHGFFQQVAEKHLLGMVGCRSCQPTASSKQEHEVRSFMEELGFSVEFNVRGLFKGSQREVDFYVPEKEVAIEFNGVYWHSDKFLDRDYHYTKFKQAAEEGIRLIQVWSDDWTLRNAVVKEHIRQVLGVSSLPKISARKTEVVEVPTSEARQFLDLYHIQGSVGATHYLGLRSEGLLVAIACFKNRKNGDLELVRYATSVNVRGGHSKLVSYVEKTLSYSNLVTFADLTFGSGDLYRDTGWEEDAILPPDYSYLDGDRRRHKFNYRLKKFREDPNLKYEEGLTERQLAQLNGLHRVYDAGKVRFVKPHPNLQ